MNLAEPVRHIGIEARYKRNARRATEPGGGNSCDGQTQHESKRGDDPAETHAGGHVAYCLDDALKNAYLILAYGDQQGEGRADVERARKNPSPHDCSGESLAGAFNFIAHY